MNTFEISPEKTGIFSNLFLDYINKEKHIAPWTNGFPELASFAKLINETSLDQANRIILQACLKNQYLNIPTTVAVKTSIDLLGNSNTFTVCTGHQLCLFTGPAYFFYKIISCIQFCRQLKKEFPENNFIPVYWMASEDHDIDEIRSTFFFSKKIEWNTNGKGKAGRLALTNLKDLLVELEKLTDNNNNGVEIFEKFNMFLDESNHLAEFIARIVNYWFGNYGLIVLDPDVVELKKIFKSEIENELISQTAIKQVHLRTDEIKNKGYEPQVNPREINLFYSGNEFRERIVYSNEKYKILNTSYEFSKDEILKELNDNPEKFSPNVVLRPLYQQTILPNIAYLGGPAEISYWLQFKSMFDCRKITYPILVPRRFIQVIDESTLHKWQKLGFVPEDFFVQPTVLVNQLIEKSNHQIKLNNEKERIDSLFSEIVNVAQQVDKGLINLIRAENQKTINGLSAIESKMNKAVREKHLTSIAKLHSILEKIFPIGELQERNENFHALLFRFSPELLDYILNQNQIDFFDKPKMELIVAKFSESLKTE